MQIKDLLARYRAEARRIPLKEALISLKSGLNPRKFFTLNTPDATGYYVTVKEMVNGKIVFHDNTDRINQEAVVRINQRSNLEKGDVLFSSAGTIGKTAYVEEEPHNWDVKEGIFLLKANQDILLPKYLYYYINSPIFKEGYSKYLKHGGTMNTISMSDFKEVDILAPSLEVQKKIVAILEEVEDLTNYLDTVIPKAIQLSKKGMLSSLEESLKFKDYDNSPVTTSEIDQLSLQKVAELKRGKTITKNTAIPGNVPVVAGGLKPSYYHNEANRDGDIISVSGSGASSGTILYWDQPIYLSDAFSIKGIEGVANTRYLYYALKNNQDYFYSLVKGAVIPHFYISDIEDFVIPVPSLETQKQVVSILDQAEVSSLSLVEYFNTINTKKDIAYKSILSKFFATSENDPILI